MDRDDGGVLVFVDEHQVHVAWSTPGTRRSASLQLMQTFVLSADSNDGLIVLWVAYILLRALSSHISIGVWPAQGSVKFRECALRW